MPIIVSGHGSMPGVSVILSGGTERTKAYDYLWPDLADDTNAVRPAQVEHTQYRAMLDKLAKCMNFADGNDRSSNIPAAYTYFGQFIDHDISAPAMLKPSINLPDVILAGSITQDDAIEEISADKIPESSSAVLASISNQQWSPLALDSLYAEPNFVADDATRRLDNALYRENSALFRLATTERIDDKLIEGSGTPYHATGWHDYPRERTAKGDFPSIADHRNDDNLILGQMHLLFMLFHQKSVALLERPDLNGGGLFAECRKLLTRHYHWCIVNDYLPRILHPKTLGDVRDRLDRDRGSSRIRAELNVPLEFTTAAFRFGHSMVRGAYDFNSNFGHGGRLMDRADARKLFKFTSAGKMNCGKPGLQLPDHWVIDWGRLLKDQKSNLIDAELSNIMNNLENELFDNLHMMIALRNMLRAYYRRLPSGQSMAKKLGMQPLTPDQIIAAAPASGDARSVLKSTGLAEHTPPWYYFLCEARKCGDGNRLGPVASYIIAETILGLITRHGLIFDADPLKHWQPEQSPLKLADGRGIRSLADIVEFVGPAKG